MTIRALSSSPRFSSYAKPTTVASAWNVPPTEGEHLVVAFATTCVGRELDKKEIINARLKFIVDLASTLEKAFTPKSEAFNCVCNCPEYLIFGIVCRKRDLKITNWAHFCFRLGTSRDTRK
jgi:hypothetical protein